MDSMVWHFLSPLSSISDLILYEGLFKIFRKLKLGLIYSVMIWKARNTLIEVKEPPFQDGE